tara:strand:+ start:1956 stop:2240 length:285 start_codon:yes stop_codon:yes gene_type:complete
MENSRESYLQRMRDISEKHPGMPRGLDRPADDEPGQNHLANIINCCLKDEYKMATSARQFGSYLYVRWGDEEYQVSVEPIVDSDFDELINKGVK